MADLSIDSNLSGSVGSTISGSVDSNISGSIGAVGPVTIDGIPSSYTFDVSHLPKIQIGVDPLTSTLTLQPIQSNISIKEIPSVRAHLPANYALAFSLFGFEIAAITLCGEGQIITEPYRPNPCEVCGASRSVATNVLQLRD
jgi:hypothetical protein